MRLPRPTEGGDFEPVPEGTWPAICYRVIDLGTQTSNFNGQEKQQHKILLSWEIHDSDCVMSDGRPMTTHQRYTWSMHEKATLRKQLEAWRGKAFNDQDFGDNGFDTKNLLGVPCLVSIVQDNKGDRVFANVASVAKLPKGMPTPGPLQNEKVYIALEPGKFDREAFGKLPDRLKQTIMDSPEYHALGKNGAGGDGANFEERTAEDVPF